MTGPVPVPAALRWLVPGKNGADEGVWPSRLCRLCLPQWWVMCVRASCIKEGATNWQGAHVLRSMVSLRRVC